MLLPWCMALSETARFQITPTALNGDLYYDLSLAPADFWNMVRSDGGDIRVTKQDGTTLLAREISGFNKAAKVGSLYFATEAIPTPNPSGVWYYVNFGNPALTEPNPSTVYGKYFVWDKSVWHVLHLEDAGNTILDSTSRQGTCQNQGATVGTGKILSARNFNGTSQCLNLYGGMASGALFPIGKNTVLTQSMWVRLTTVPTGALMIPAFTSQTDLNSFLFSFQINGSAWSGGPSKAGVADQLITNPSNVTAGTWHMLTLVLTGGSFSFYQDGVQVGVTTAYNATINSALIVSHTWFMGKIVYGGANYSWFKGDIDEERTWDRALSSTEINILYLNQNNPGAFWTTGTIETSILPWSPSLAETNRFQITPIAVNADLYYDLSLAPPEFWDKVRPDGGDIRITKQDGTTLCAREISGFDRGAHVGSLYIATNSGTSFYVNYGNHAYTEPAPGSTYGQFNAWEASAVGVWHLEANGNDSTVNANNGTSVWPPKFATGKILNAGNFNGTTEFLQVNPGAINLNPLPAGTGTILTWFKAASAANVNNYVFTKGDDATFLSWGMDIIPVDATHSLWALLYASSGVIRWAATPSALKTPTNWHHYAAVMNANNTQPLYTDGALAATGALSVITPNASLGCFIGKTARAAPNQYFAAGMIDELRIYTRCLSATEIANHYANQNDPGAFWTTGAEEPSSLITT